MNHQEVPVKSATGGTAGNISLNEKVFGVQQVPSVVHDVVVWQLAKRRSGTSAAKTRSQMNYSGKKPWKQKGSGRARAGSKSSPVWVGGAVAHGPTQRDYTTRVPKASRRLALASVLTNKLSFGKLHILEGFGELDGKTSSVVNMLGALNLSGRKVVFVMAESNDMLLRGAKNLPDVLALPFEGLNVYDLLKFEHVVMEKSVLELLDKRFSKAGK